MDHQFARINEPQLKFPLGRIVATQTALNRIPSDEIVRALSRHARGDWGMMDAEDWKTNESALKNGGRLFSQFHTAQQIKFWIITESDRSVTTVLLPEDY